MGNDQSSSSSRAQHCSSPLAGWQNSNNRRRPSDAVARVDLPSSPVSSPPPLFHHHHQIILEPPTAPESENSDKNRLNARRLNAFRQERPKSSMQLGSLMTHPKQTNSGSIFGLNYHRPSVGALAPRECLQSPSRQSPFTPPVAHKSQKQLLLSSNPSQSQMNIMGHLNSPQRNRRMSVAGDEVTRRELSRLEGAEMAGTGLPGSARQHRVVDASETSTTMESGCSTPQRRISRAKLELSSHINRRSSKAVDHGYTNITGESIAEHIRITSYQSLMVQQNWTRIKANVFCGVFRDLASKNAVAKECIQKLYIVDNFSNVPVQQRNFDQKEHIRLLVDLFDFTISNLNNPYCKIVQQKCTKIGELHFSAFGSANEAQMWEDLGESLTQAIARADAARGKREAFRAWISLISFLVDSMKAGYVKMFKRKSLSRSSGGFATITMAANEEIISVAATANNNCNNIALPSEMPSRRRSRTPTPQLSSLQLIH